MHGVTSGVLLAKVDGHEDRKNAAHSCGREQNDVSGVVVRRLRLSDDEGGSSSSQVALHRYVSRLKGVIGSFNSTYKSDVHGNTNTTLKRSTNVVTVPGHTLWDVGVDSGGDHEASEVLSSIALNTSQDGETDDTGVCVST